MILIFFFNKKNKKRTAALPGNPQKNTRTTFAQPKKNNYLYNGKELQTEHGLDWHDYGARFYDAQVARFLSVDPKAEEFGFQSPYVYAGNNPVRYEDFRGKGPIDKVKKKYKKLKRKRFEKKTDKMKARRNAKVASYIASGIPENEAWAKVEETRPQKC